MTAPQQIAAFEAVYRAEHRRLLRYLGRRVGLDDAPDLAQEAFLRLFGSGMLAHIDNPRAYLTRIASNLSADRARRRARRPAIAWTLDEARGAPAPPGQAQRIEAIDVLRFYRRTFARCRRRPGACS